MNAFKKTLIIASVAAIGVSGVTVSPARAQTDLQPSAVAGAQVRIKAERFEQARGKFEKVSRPNAKAALTEKRAYFKEVADLLERRATLDDATEVRIKAVRASIENAKDDRALKTALVELRDARKDHQVGFVRGKLTALNAHVTIAEKRIVRMKAALEDIRKAGDRDVSIASGLVTEAERNLGTVKTKVAEMEGLVADGGISNVARLKALFQETMKMLKNDVFKKLIEATRLVKQQ